MTNSFRKKIAHYSKDISESRLDVLDGLRVLFIALIAWFHIWQQSWLSPYLQIGQHIISFDFLPRAGYLLVDGMLLLSGLLLYYPVAQGHEFKTAVFYKKRLIRILPSYLLCLILMLLFVALPQGSYGTSADLWKDIVSHLTFTFNFSYATYISTPLNGALWTVAVEMQFYLLFPLLAKAFRRKPVVTFCTMCAAAFIYRAWVGTLDDTTLYVNQFPAFLDIFALGFAGAELIVCLQKRMKNETKKEKLFFSALAALALVLLVQLMQDQAGCNGYPAIRQGQMDRRFSLGCILTLLMVSLCFSLPAFRFAFGNRGMGFLASISFQFYIYHQVLAVQLKKYGIPFCETSEPWYTGDLTWQIKYTALCFGGALILAILVTFLFEKPVARLLSGIGKQKKTSADNG